MVRQRLRLSAHRPGVSTLVELVQSGAAGQPDRRALCFLRDGEEEAGHVTWRQLDQRARRVAELLRRYCDAGDRVLLLQPSGSGFVEAFFGCLYAGMIAVPGYPPRRGRPDSRLRSIAVDASPRALITDPSALAWATALVEDLETPVSCLTFEGLGDGEGPLTEPHHPTADSLAYLQYTSGSTADPRGVMVSHGNVIDHCSNAHRVSRLDPEHSTATRLPPFHDMGLVDGIIQPLYSGCLGVVMAPTAFLRRPIRWLRAVTNYRVSHTGGPNLAFDLCVAKTTRADREGLDLSRWTTAYNGSEPVRSETLRAFCEVFRPFGFKSRAFNPVYGLAEATLMVSAGVMSEEPTLEAFDGPSLENGRAQATDAEQDRKTLVSCGEALWDVDVVIADPKAGARCEPGVVGEIWVAGPIVTLGYWRRPEATAETFGARLSDGSGPYLRTGDLGFVQDGQLFVTGRVKDLIIVRGRNIYPQDLELSVLACHPAIRPHCTAAFSIDLEGAERVVVAAEIQRTSVKNLDVDEACRRIRTVLSEQHEVQAYAVLLLPPGGLPKTSSGKVARHGCRKRFLLGDFETIGGFQLPLEQLSLSGEPLVGAGSSAVDQSSVEGWIIQELASVLNLKPDDVDPRARFSEYGVDSLAAVEIMHDLQEWMGRPLPETLLWDRPTVVALAEYLTGEGSAEEADTEGAGQSSDLPESGGTDPVTGLPLSPDVEATEETT